MPRFLVGIAVALLACGLAAVIYAERGRFTGGPAGGAADAAVEDGAAADGAVTPEPAARPAAAAVSPFADWPRPAVAVVLSGEAHGYLEPCGCTEKQSGGVARRADLFRQLRARGWEVTAADLGGLVARDRSQTDYKFAAMLDALRIMGYPAVGLGPEEAALTADYLAQFAGGEPSFLSSNMVFYEDPAMFGGPLPATVIEAGGVTIGLASVLGDSVRDEVDALAAKTFVTSRPADETLPAALGEIADADVKILLAHATPAESRELAERYPAFDAVLTARGPEDPGPKPERVGGTRLLRVGQKGKSVGVLGVYPDAADGQPRFRWALVDLNRDEYAHDTDLDPVMAAYQATLRDNLEAVFADLPGTDPPRGGDLDGAYYTGAKACGECHTKAYAKWSTTGHARAYESLVTGREHFEGTWVPRTSDPECLSCHVTGWEPQEAYPYHGGFLPERLAAADGHGERFALLQGQQCENCHGPGASHAAVMARWQADPKSVPQSEFRAANRQMQLKLADAENTCVRCHDLNNSPGFQFAAYWEKVRHNFRD